MLTDGLPRLEAEIAKVARARRRGCCPGDAAFRLYDTFGVPYDFIEDTAATHGVTVDQAGVRARHGGAARQGARAERVRRRKKGDAFARAPTKRRSRTPAISSRATRAPALTGVPIVALFDEQRQPGRRARRRRDRLRRARADAVLPRGRRPGVGLGPHRQRSDAARRPTSRGSPASARACRARIACGSSAARCACGDIVTAEVDAERARRDAPQPHGDAPAPRGAAPGARHARQAGRLARRARSAALRLRRTSRPSRATSCDRIERIVNEQIVPEHAGRHRGALDRGGDRRRRDGAVRREVRRHGARRQRAGLQPGAVRRHARARDRRHRVLRDRRRERRRGRRAPHRGAHRARRGRAGRSSSARALARVLSTRCTSNDDQARRGHRAAAGRHQAAAREVTQLKTEARDGRRRPSTRRRRHDRRRRREARAAQGRRTRQGRAARPGRLAQGTDQERRRRPRRRRTTARCRSSSRSRRT